MLQGYVIQTRPIEFVRGTALVAVCNSAERARLRPQNHRSVHCGDKALPGLSLSQLNVAIEAAKPADVDSYLRKELRRFRRLRKRLPTALGSWHHKRTAPIHLLLRTVQRDWPPVVLPTTPLEIFHQQLLDGCAGWLADCRGLATKTIVARRMRPKRIQEKMPMPSF